MSELKIVNLPEEFVKDEIIQLVEEFFQLTEKIKFKEETEINIIANALYIRFSNDFKHLTIDQIKSAIHLGLMGEYGEYKRTEEAIRLIPRFVNAYRNNQHKENKSTVNVEENEKRLIEKGKEVFKDHILLFIHSKACIMCGENLVGPDYDKSAFDAYLNSETKTPGFQDFYLSSFDENFFRPKVKRRIEQEKKMVLVRNTNEGGLNVSRYLKNHNPEKTATALENYYLYIVALYQYLRAKGVNFKPIS